MRYGARTGAALVVLALITAVAARPAHAVPTSGPAAAAYVQLQTTRAALADRAPTFTDPYVRQYLGTAIALLDDALLPVRWSSTGVVLDAAGHTALEDMRQATAWLVWADTGLRDATLSDQTNIIGALGQVVHSRYDEVSRFIGEGSGPNPWALWVAGYYLNEGDALMSGAVMHAALDYISAWQSLLGQPPCC